MEKDLSKVAENSYNEDSIQVLEGLEAVRVRPGMYIGSTSSTGLHHLVWEIVDNAVDEALAGYCNHVILTITQDNQIVVDDNGRGIPTGIHKQTGISTVETVMTILHAGGKFGKGGGYKASGGLHGVGASVVNALSTSFEVWVHQKGDLHYIQFVSGGHIVKPLSIIGKTSRTGTVVKFKPDATIFTETQVYNYDTLRDRLRQLAFLNKGIKMDIVDERSGATESFFYEGGVAQYVQFLNKDKPSIHPSVIAMESVEQWEAPNGDIFDIGIEVSCQYTTNFNQVSIYSFCNNIHTSDGGTHEDGFRNAMTKVINAYAKSAKVLKQDDDPFTADDVREGITALVSVKHPNPQYEGQTKHRLGNSELRSIVSKVVSEQFERFLLENPAEAKLILEKVSLNAKGRIAGERARELTQRKGTLEISSLPGKLADCSSKDAAKCEIFIVEGNSAGGTAKQGRNREFQAILPLRGKILNVQKASMESIFRNQEIGNMIIAFGTDINQNFNIEKLRYHKIVIMTDADVDGAHIRTLLLTFFYRFLRPLITDGYVYIAQSPLFKVTVGKNIQYAYTEEEMARLKKELGDARYNIQRYKGLGEMNAEQLWETTMDPEVRTMYRVTIEDAIEADQVFEMLMGEEVEPRRNFILDNAKFVQNLDI